MRHRHTLIKDGIGFVAMFSPALSLRLSALSDALSYLVTHSKLTMDFRKFGFFSLIHSKTDQCYWRGNTV